MWTQAFARPVLAAVLLLAASAPSHAGEIYFDLSPFTPGGVTGEVLGVSSATGLIVGARIDATLVVEETGPWSMSVQFVLPIGAAGISSTDEGWSGAGTFTKSFHTNAFNGQLGSDLESALFFWFLGWSGGTPFTLPGGGEGIGPLDGYFSELRLTLFTADCPLADPLVSWTTLGGAIPGGGGAPSLAGLGSLCPGEPALVTLTNGAAGAPAVLVLGATELSLPLFGGLLVPAPDLLLPMGSLSPSGSAALPLTWPAGAPPGISLWFQGWVIDPSAPSGLAATNGLRGKAP